MIDLHVAFNILKEDNAVVTKIRTSLFKILSMIMIRQSIFINHKTTIIMLLLNKCSAEKRAILWPKILVTGWKKVELALTTHIKIKSLFLNCLWKKKRLVTVEAILPIQMTIEISNNCFSIRILLTQTKLICLLAPLKDKIQPN